jgi:hypothetical protein
MNLVGKILTVFILVMSIFFCACAVMVYATHKNWREVVMRPRQEAAPGKPAGLMFQLEDEKNHYDKLKAEKDDLDARLTAEKDAAVQALAKLSNEYDQLKIEIAQLKKDRDQSDQERREALAQLANTEQRLAAMRKEIEGDAQTPGLRKEILQAQTEREQFFNEVVRLTDEKRQAVNELKRLRDYQVVLRQDLDKAVAVLRKFGFQPEPELYRDQPPLVEGYVKAGQDKDNLVEISIGSDEGLLKGHKLEVYRPTGYVGRIEVVKTAVDTAVCQVVPGYQKSRIQPNDLVTSRLLR